jgi:predicted ATP-grasp superfamily ATP-dependent carboligase
VERSRRANRDKPAVKIFVTDGDQRPALAIVRSLGLRGMAVLVGEARQASLASSSRYCSRHVTYPSPYDEPDAFERFLLAFVEQEDVDLVVPVTDVTTSIVARAWPALGRHTSTTAPPFDAFDFVSDKGRLLRCACRCGVPIPRTLFVDRATGLNDVVDHVSYPAVIKPCRSRIPTHAGWLGTTVHYANAESDLRRLYDEIPYLASYPSMIQERIVGPGLGVFVLFDRGRLATAFAHRRIREKPPSGGVSVMCEAVPVDPQLTAHAIRLLGPLRWHGVAMLEYKLDRRTGIPVLMEVNGRFWGSLQLAVDAGVDFPYLNAQLALGRRPDFPDAYRAGVKSRWLLGDLDHLLSRVFKTDRDLRLPDGAPSRWRTALDFLKFFAPGLRHEVERFEDPLPFLRETHRYVSDLVASAARGMR